MKIHRRIGCALLAGLAVFVLTFSDNYLAAQLKTRTGFPFLQDKTTRLPGTPTPPNIQSATKATGNLLVKPSFRISDTPTLSTDRGAGSAEIAFNPDDNEYLVVWESDGLTELKGVNDIYGRRLSATTNERIGIDFRISSLSAGDKNHRSNGPKVIYNTTAHEYLVVWNGSGLLESPDKFFEIYGQRLSRAGKEVGSTFRVSFTTDLGKVNTSFVRTSAQVDVAWNSTNNEYMVIWQGMGEPQDAVKMEIYGQRLNANGELLGKYFRISHTSDQGNNFHANAPAISYNNRNNQYLVVWSGGFKNEAQVEVWGRGLSADGAGPTTDFRISQVTDVGANRRARSPRVIYNSANNEYFVVFQANALPGESSADVNEIFGQRIDGATLAETGTNDFRISNTIGAGNRANKPAVTYNSVAKEYLVIWRSVRENGQSEVFGQLISSGGTEIETDFQISNITAVGKDRSVNSSSLTYHAGHGDYLVVWQGNGLPNAAKITEIFGQQLTPARSQRQ